MSAPASCIGPAAAAIVSSLRASVWRADQMGTSHAAVTPSGHAMLDSALPHGGWPAAALIELLLQQPGIGEMRLLRPALAAIAKTRPVALVQPPHMPQAGAWSAWGMAAERLLWVKAARTADALWSAEQILKNGSCGALVFWQPHIRTEALRRLHLAAQSFDTVFWMLRPIAAAEQPSPAPLRLMLRPAMAGVAVRIVKRRGPHCDDVLTLPLGERLAAFRNLTPDVPFSHAPLDRCPPALAAARNFSSVLV